MLVDRRRRKLLMQSDFEFRENFRAKGQRRMAGKTFPVLQRAVVGLESAGPSIIEKEAGEVPLKNESRVIAASIADGSLPKKIQTGAGYVETRRNY